ncbi:hypothetical protein T439DRAFT_384217 [Meredithblackwellia eburnea MCA 4105]
MENLKLRFNSSARSPIPSSPDVPTSPSSTSDGIRSPGPGGYPVLTSRFSNETLAVKTPRSFTHHRWFSHSPPASPKYPSGGVHHRHSGSESSKLNISSPTQPSRSGDEQEQEVLSSPKLSSEDPSVGRTPVKMVGSVEEAFAFARGHGRHSSSGSNDSSTSTFQRPQQRAPPAARSSPSFSSPTRPPQPTRAAPRPPIPTPASRTVSPTPPSIPRSELPPRSDSRNGFVGVSSLANIIASQTNKRAQSPAPATTATATSAPTLTPPAAPSLYASPIASWVKKASAPAPSPTPTAALPPRPHSPPSAEVRPLSISRSKLLPSTSGSSTPAPQAPAPAVASPFFLATLVRPLSSNSAALRSNNDDAVRVEIDVGGKKFVTQMNTLVQKGGKLGEFVVAAVEEARREVGKNRGLTEGKRQDSGDSLYSSSLAGEIGPVAMGEKEKDDDSVSMLSSNHFDVSPFPSPFPFSSFDGKVDMADEQLISALSLEAGINTSPSSPVDPFARKMFLNLPPPTLSAPSAGKQARLVTTPRLRVTSVHPSICSSAPPLSKNCNTSPTDNSTRHQLTSPTSSVCGGDEEDLDWRPSFVKSGHTSTDFNPFENSLGPFFQVLQGQARTEVDADGVEREFGFKLDDLERDLPVDVGVINEEENKSRSTMLGVPRGVGSLNGKRSLVGLSTKALALERNGAPPVPKVEVERSSVGSRPPSLSMSLSSDEGLLGSNEEGDKTLVDEEDEKSPIEVFIDRDGNIFSHLLHFLRNGSLPADLTLPTSPQDTSCVDRSLLSLFSLHPPSAFNLLATLRNTRAEALWFGMQEVVDACEVEREKLIKVIKGMEEKRNLDAVEAERRRRAEVMVAREKAGWI